MADIQHKDITDPNIHEPKGVKFASAGTAYLADGVGGGAWSDILVPGGLTGASGAFYQPSRNLGAVVVPNGSIFPFTSWPVSLNWGDLKISSIGGFLAISAAGVYLLKIRLSGKHIGSDSFETSMVTLALTRNQGSYVALHSTFFPSIVTPLIGQNDEYPFDSGWMDAVVRLEPAQGVGVWATGVDDGNNRVVRTNLTLQMQMVRLSDG